MAWGKRLVIYITGMDIKSLQGATGSSETAWLVVINLFCSSAFLLQRENVSNTHPAL